MYMPFYAAYGATCMGFLFFLFAFSSPYWLESYALVHSSFLHMGIWSICFDNFIHPQDYHANVLTGCYWVYDRFFFKIGIWEWLNPYWLIAVQVLVVIAFVAELCCVIVMLLYYLLYGQPAAESTIAFGLQLFVGILLTTVIITFGLQSQDRQWMQRPDQNFLSWSYGFLILATICSFIASGFLHCVSYTDRAAQEEVEFFEATEGQIGLRSTIMGSYMPGQASTMFSRSLYGVPPSGVGGVVVNVPSTGDKPSQVLELGTDLRPVESYLGTGSVMEPLRGAYAAEPRSVHSNESAGSYMDSYSAGGDALSGSLVSSGRGSRVPLVRSAKRAPVSGASGSILSTSDVSGPSMGRPAYGMQRDFYP